MYYLVVKNLGLEKCIDMNEKDIYTKVSSFNCQQALTYVKKKFVRKVTISCSGLPGTKLNARVYKD